MLQEELLNEYIEEHASTEHPYLHALYRATQIQLLRPRMASGHAQGVFLRLIARLTQAQSVLEIGTYSGYSALSMAQGMPKGGKLLTFEINDEQECFTRPWLEQSPFDVEIEMIVGDIFQLLPQRQETYDLVFIDANKRDYLAYYSLVMPHLQSGSVILADNTLWDNHVIDPQYQNDEQTAAIKAFNDFVANDPRVECVILPMRDGLTLIRVK